VPPTVGFYAKLAVLRAVIDVGMVWLAVFAVLFSVVGAFYYLRVIKFMYFDKADDDTPLAANTDMRAVMSVNGLIVLALGIYPSALMTLCAAVMS
jgi:NADH-quinone oxidoreductase subunit N